MKFYFFLLIFLTRGLLATEELDAKIQFLKNDELSPVSSSYKDTYSYELASSMTKEVKGQILASAIIMPSFEPERALFLVKEEIYKETGPLPLDIELSRIDFNLIIIEAKKSFYELYFCPELKNDPAWKKNFDRFKKEKLFVTKIIKIDEKLSSLMHKLWLDPIMAVSNSQVSTQNGLDGVTYEFGVFMPYSGFLKGEQWEGDKPNILLKITKEIMNKKESITKRDLSDIIDKFSKNTKNAHSH